MKTNVECKSSIQMAALLLGAVVALFAQAVFAYDPDDAIHAEALKPQGQRYEATVPDTLDLAERARLSVHGLTSFLNPAAEYAPYGHTYFNGNPAYMSDMPGGPPNWGKIVESLLFTRVMCGSEENLEIDAKTLVGMIRHMQINPTAPTPVSRCMLALMAAYQLDSNPGLKNLIDTMAQDHVRHAQVKDGMAFYYDGEPDLRETALGVTGYWLNVFITGCAIRPLVRWHGMTEQQQYLDLSGKLTRYLVQPKLWQPEAAPTTVCGSDHAQFCGHHHSYTQALMGLLWYAEATNDIRLKQFAREGYEYLRTFGIARIGLFGEGCTTGDMTMLALKLSRMGVGDYWDDADQYVRNHLAELQITDAERLRGVVAKMPDGRGKNDTTQGPFDPANESKDNVVERNAGVFFSDSTHPTLIPEHSLLYTICCTGNCTVAMYAAWDSIVQEKEGAVQVNLLLNRASPWLDLDSYLPCEGRVVIRNKVAQRVSVRLPGWVDCKAVESSVNGEKASPWILQRYLVFDVLRPGDTVEIRFPVGESTETYALKWRQSEFWKESTYPGPQWTPPDLPTRYTCRFRGNTLMDITPRDEGLGYPLYQRSGWTGEKAPMKQVARYVAPIVPRWQRSKASLKSVRKVKEVEQCIL